MSVIAPPEDSMREPTEIDEINVIDEIGSSQQPPPPDPDPIDSHQTPDGFERVVTCLLYTSPSPRDRTRSRMPSSA